MTGALADAFANAAKDDRAALVIYVCAGDPDLATTVEVVVAAAEAGADVIELGVPFSDPTADGPAIQQAAERSLRNGTTIAGVMKALRDIRARTPVPILLFGYYNPIFRYGEERFVTDAADAGANGLLVVDLPPEESDALRGLAAKRGLGWVPLVAPTSTPDRIAKAAEVANGFVYYVSMTGITGSKAADLAGAGKRAAELSETMKQPVAVGFGIKTAGDAQAVAARADGVVVGSAIVRAIAQAGSRSAAVSAVSERVASLRQGVERV